VWKLIGLIVRLRLLVQDEERKAVVMATKEVEEAIGRTWAEEASRVVLEEARAAAAAADPTSLEDTDQCIGQGNWAVDEGI
jgi:hypothetical protein